jgi:hypothetical protein
MAATNPSRAVRQNATGQQHLLPADNHGHAGLLAWSRNNDECWAVPAKHWYLSIMQIGQQPMAAPMMMNYYSPNQQPNQQLGYF